MENTIQYAELDKKILSLIKSYKDNSDSLVLLEEEFINFDTLFPNKNAYWGILRKALLQNKNGNIEFQKLTDPETCETSLFISAKNCPELYAPVYRQYGDDNFFGIMPETKKISGNIEYCLLIDKTGDIKKLLAFENEGTSVYGPNDSMDILFLNIPLMISGILNQEKETKAKNILENIVNKNPSSTISNIFHYIKDNKNEIKNLSSQLDKLDKMISYSTRRRERDGYRKDNNRFFPYFSNGKNSSSVRYKAAILENNIPAIELELYNKQLSNPAIREIVDNFPILILSSENEIVPCYLKNEHYSAEKIAEVIKNNPDGAIEIDREKLITLDEKIEEKFVISKNKIKEKYVILENDKYNYLPSYESTKERKAAANIYKKFEKGIKIEEKTAKTNITDALVNNVKGIMLSFDLHYGEVSSNEVPMALEKMLKSQRRTNKACEKNLNKISKILAKIYRKEILLQNL